VATTHELIKTFRFTLGCEGAPQVANAPVTEGDFTSLNSVRLDFPERRRCGPEVGAASPTERVASDWYGERSYIAYARRGCVDERSKHRKACR